MKLVFQDSLIFQILYFFTVFMPLLWQTQFFGKYCICFEIVGNFYGAVNHCHKRKFFCCSEPLQRRKFLCCSDPLQQREMPFVSVNHSNKGKLICCSEPLRRQKIPMSLWTTATKENSYVAVNHYDKIICLLTQWTTAIKGKKNTVLNKNTNSE